MVDSLNEVEVGNVATQLPSCHLVASHFLVAQLRETVNLSTLSCSLSPEKEPHRTKKEMAKAAVAVYEQAVDGPDDGSTSETRSVCTMTFDESLAAHNDRMWEFPQQAPRSVATGLNGCWARAASGTKNGIRNGIRFLAVYEELPKTRFAVNQ